MKVFLKAFITGFARFLRESDIFLLVLALASSIYGVLLIASTAYVQGGAQVTVQIVAIVIGVGLFVLFSYFDIDIIADKSTMLFVISALLMATLLLWGEGAGEGARASWLRFGEIGIQPGVVTKIPFIIIISKMITDYKERKTLDGFFSMAKIGGFAAIFIGIVFWTSNDLGTVFAYFFMLIMILFIGGIKLRWFLLGAAIVSAVSPFMFWRLLDYRHRYRLMAPFIPYDQQETFDPGRELWYWQSDLSIEAISAGGWTGAGLGNGRITQAGILPFQHTDFIFSVAGEELGFIGAILIVVLLVAIVIRCIYVGIKSNNSLGMLVCAGVASMVTTQLIMNVGMALGVLPVIGVALPFISYGGSSIVTFFAGMGLVSGIKMRPKQSRY